jgi:hypothetical protein
VLGGVNGVAGQAAWYGPGRCQAQSVATWTPQATIGRVSSCRAAWIAGRWRSRPRWRRQSGARATVRGSPGAPSTSRGAATMTSSMCWAMWATNSSWARVSRGDSRARATVASPAAKQAAGPPDGAPGPAPQSRRSPAA